MPEAGPDPPVRRRGLAAASIGHTQAVNLRIAAGVVAACLGVILASAPVLSAPAIGLGSDHSVIERAASHASTAKPAAREAARIALYGDSLISEAGQDFAYLAALSGASVQVHQFPGTSPCNYFTSMATVAQDWHPTVAELVFTGDVFTTCNGSVLIGSPQYYARYKDEIHTAISIFRAVGAKVVLIGQPADASVKHTKTGKVLNRLYQSIAAASPGVSYDDAGSSVTAKGRFTWRLPCLPHQPCTGPGHTNIVRSPDGVHFCPNGQTTIVHGFEQCDIYSSGAFRFASALLKAALGASAAGR